MALIKNNMPHSPFKEIIKDQSVFLWIAATRSQAVSLHVMRSIVCVDLWFGSFGNKVKRDSQIAVSNRSYEEEL